MMRARRLLRLGVAAGAAWLTAGRTASAAEYYVAPGGDTIWIRGGTYRPTTGKSSMAGFVISKSGTSDTNRIKFFAVAGELPVFDFSQLPLGTSTSAGIYVTGSWLH